MSTVACPSCGQENPAGFRLCGMCGTALDAGRPSPREERKVVTVLFCDLVGFTSRAERLDPEDVRAVLGPYHERLRTELERYGGTVEKFIGDAVMAVFGAPTAHEDDPERAVRAALAIREAIAQGEDLRVRIGVTTGEALVNLGARPETGEGMAAGDVVNTAARLESSAPVDGILVDETTYRATERAIEYREGDPVLAKGKAEPIRVWEAVAARSRLGLDVGERTATPLVGRELELEILTAAFARARDERVAQLVTLVGVPGIGKSRLLMELFRRVDEEPELVRWRQGRCLPYGEGVALWALAEIVKAEAGVLETDSAEQAAEKLVRSVRTAVTDESEAAWVEGHLRPLAGLDGGVELGGDRKDEAFAAWRRFLEGVAEQGPLVLVVEDLQWADETLLEFVDHLVDWATDVPLLAVATARPELLSAHPHWGGGKANATTHSLAPLTDEETTALVHAVLGRPVLPADVQQSLLLNAGGNPLYAEEFARMLSERGGGDGQPALPESVQGIIAARLDGLDPAEKELLQDAAVVGKVFWLGVLEALGGGERWRLERRLHELERRELVRRDRQSAVGGERQYAFRHLLVREVAYGQIPRARRAEKHAAVARWIERLSPDRSEDRADMLAHHYLEALRYAEAAGADTSELVAPAYAALHDAGDRALTLNAAPAAAQFYARALTLAPEGGRPPQLLLRYGRSLYLSGAHEEAEGILGEAAVALAAAGDAVGEAFAQSLRGNISWHGGDTQTSRERLVRAVELVRDAPPSITKAHVLAQAGSAEMVAGSHEEALRLGREALALAESFALAELQAHALDTIGSSRVHLGDPRGIGDLERAVELALGANSVEAARALNNLSSALRDQGHLTRARAAAEEGVRVAERLGARSMHRFLRSVTAIDAYFAGDWERATRLADEFIAEAERSPHYQEGGMRIGRATMRLARDDVEGARADLERSLELARRIGEPQALLAPLGFAARILAELDDLEGARALAHEFLGVLRSDRPGPGFHLLAPIAARLGVVEEVSEIVGDPAGHESPWLAAARASLDGRLLEAAEIFAAMPNLPEEAEARTRAAEQLVAAGRRAEADVELRRALAFWRSVGATRYVRKAEALLAASA